MLLKHYHVDVREILPHSVRQRINEFEIQYLKKQHAHMLLAVGIGILFKTELDFYSFVPLLSSIKSAVRIKYRRK